MRELEKQLSSASFKTGFKGYQPGQVDAFLDSLQEQARQMDAEMNKMEAELARYRVMAARLAELALRGPHAPRALAPRQQESTAEPVPTANPVGGEETADDSTHMKRRMELAIRKLYAENKRLKAENLQMKTVLAKEADAADGQ